MWYVRIVTPRKMSTRARNENDLELVTFSFQSISDISSDQRFSTTPFGIDRLALNGVEVEMTLLSER